MAEVIEFIPDGATLPNVPQDACCNRAHKTDMSIDLA